MSKQVTRLPKEFTVSGGIATLTMSDGEQINYKAGEDLQSSIVAISHSRILLCVHAVNKNAALRDIYHIVLEILGYTHDEFKDMIENDWEHAVNILEFMQAFFTLDGFTDVCYLGPKSQRDDALLEPIFKDWKGLPIIKRDPTCMYYVPAVV